MSALPPLPVMGRVLAVRRSDPAVRLEVKVPAGTDDEMLAHTRAVLDTAFTEGSRAFDLAVVAP